MTRRTRLLLCLPLLASAAGCDVAAPARVDAPADTAAGEISFRLVGPNQAALVVPVFINGEGPLDFVLDTGATLTCVEQATAERLGLPERRGVRGIGFGVGSAGALRLVGIDSLRVGQAQAFDLPGCVLDLQHIGALGTDVEGLLGLNFLRSFRMTLDFQRNVLLLVEP